MSNIESDENTGVKDNWKCALSPACISHLNQNLCNSVSGAQCSFTRLSDYSNGFNVNENLIRSETQRDHSVYNCGRTVVKKARHSTYSQPTLKAFFKQSKAPDFMATVNTDTPNSQANSEKQNENMFHETEPACDKNLMENIEEKSTKLIVPTTDLCAQDTNSCFSLKMEKGNAAVLEWQKIQEKMRTSIPLCKGHREPCVARSVKKGPNVGRRFYVCARAKVLDLLHSLFSSLLKCLFLNFSCYWVNYLVDPIGLNIWMKEMAFFLKPSILDLVSSWSVWQYGSCRSVMKRKGDKYENGKLPPLREIGRYEKKGENKK